MSNFVGTHCSCNKKFLPCWSNLYHACTNSFFPGYRHVWIHVVLLLDESGLFLLGNSSRRNRTGSTTSLLFLTLRDNLKHLFSFFLWQYTVAYTPKEGAIPIRIPWLSTKDNENWLVSRLARTIPVPFVNQVVVEIESHRTLCHLHLALVSGTFVLVSGRWTPSWLKPLVARKRCA